jgi:hypothetical protein
MTVREIDPRTVFDGPTTAAGLGGVLAAEIANIPHTAAVQ